jgi:hypothetical protein
LDLGVNKILDYGKQKYLLSALPILERKSVVILVLMVSVTKKKKFNKREESKNGEKEEIK